MRRIKTVMLLNNAEEPRPVNENPARDHEAVELIGCWDPIVPPRSPCRGQKKVPPR